MKLNANLAEKTFTDRPLMPPDTHINTARQPALEIVREEGLTITGMVGMSSEIAKYAEPSTVASLGKKSGQALDLAPKNCATGP